MKHTKLFVVLDEATLLTMKGANNRTAKFATEEEADWAAAGKLEMWTVVEVNFKHRFLHHKV